MAYRVLTFGQFIGESAAEHVGPNSRIMDILVMNRDRIKDEANVDDIVFNKVLDNMSQDPPKSLEEEDVVADAISMAYMLKSDDEAYMRLDQGDRMQDEIDQFSSGRAGVAVQNIETSSEDDGY